MGCGVVFEATRLTLRKFFRESARLVSIATGFARLVGENRSLRGLLGSDENNIQNQENAKMRVMVMVKATESSEAGEMPSEQLMADMMKFNEELVEAGIMRAGDGLKPSSEGLRVRFSGRDRIVTTGPFVETTELLAGYWLWEVESMEEAIEWVKRCPNPMLEDSDIEIRPLYELDDFSDADPEGTVRKREKALSGAIAGQEAVVQPYLFFSGRCEEALEFYKNAIGAKIGMMLRFAESPDQPPEGALAEGFENKIMHADFTVGNLTVMASDGCQPGSSFDGFRLSLLLRAESDVDRVFEALADGGKVDMPLGKTFWSPRFGMVTDRFGIGWMVMLPEPDRAHSPSMESCESGV